MAAPPRARLVLVLAVLQALPLAAPASMLQAAPAAPVRGPLRDFASLAELAREVVPAPDEALDTLLASLPMPLGPSPGEQALLALDALPEPWEGPDVAVTGNLTLDADWNVGDLTLENATVVLNRSGLSIRVSGSLLVRDSTVRTAGTGSSWTGFLEARKALDVQRATFEGVSLTARSDGSFSSPSRVADTAFRHGSVGIAADRPNLEVRGSTFLNLTVGLDVLDAHGAPEKGPAVHNNTFEMNRFGVRVAGESAGSYEHNLARANFLGVFCTSPGGEDANGALHKPRFEENNLYTNYGEALSGLRGVTINSPLGNVTIPDSACDHDRPYLGPAGAARDTAFLSPQDSLTDIQAQANPTSAPGLPLPIREVTATETWGPGSVSLSGPVVVNSPGNLTIDDATLRGPYFVGAKANGKVTVRDTTMDPFNVLVLRNDADSGANLELLGPEARNPVTMYRCNCSLRGSNLTYGGGPGIVLPGGVVVGGVGIAVSGGILTDDTVWRPEIRDNEVRGRAIGLMLANVKPAVSGNTIEGGTLGLINALSTTTFDDNTILGANIGVADIVGTLTSTGNTYEAGAIGVLGLVDTIAFSQDVFAGFQIALLPALPVTASATLSNFTFNGVGVFPALGVATVTSSNFVHNYHMALLTVPIDTGSVNIPSGVTCTTCWGPDDEARWGNVTYTSALGPNEVPKPGWAGKEKVAQSGETLDLEGTLEAPAVARSGGTLRVVNGTLDLAGRFPVGAKGGGISGGGTGKLVLENATLWRGGFVALNSTDSRIVHTRFVGFPDAALSAMWNGGSYACDEVRDGPVGFRFLLHKGEALELGRWLVSNASGVRAGLQDDIILAQDVTVEDSGIVRPRGGGLLHRMQPGEMHLHRSNLLGKGRVGAQDAANSLPGLPASPFNATDNWWDDPAGPNRNGARMATGSVAPLLEPFATQPFAPQPCAAFRVVTQRPADDAPVAFEDRTIDPSALGLEAWTWDFGDGSAPQVAGSPALNHQFPDGGRYNVTLTVRSRSGAEANVTLPLDVAHTPPRPATDAVITTEIEPVQFTDLSTHGNPNDAPPDGWSYAWDLNGEASSTERNPSHRFADGGSKLIALHATDNDGLGNEASKTIQVPHVAPLADFSSAGSAETDTFQLTDTSTHPNAPTDGVVSRSWSCSDGFTSSAQEPAHKFADGGSYDCTLGVTDDDAMSSTVTKTLRVAHVAPSADFATPGGTELGAIPFTDTSTHPNPADAPPAGWVYAWDFGDGGAGAERNPTHDYADGGSYTVRLTATDNDGLASNATRAVSITHVAPLAAFGFSPPTPDPGEPVSFTDASAHPNAPVDSLTNWAWDFGDGNTSAERHPMHVFDVQGLYDVRLTVTDDDGLSASVNVRVPVGNLPPVPAWSHDPQLPTDLETVDFTDASTDPDGTIAAWLWDFGDGSTSVEQHAQHRFADDGLYTVSLTVTDNLGASASLAKALEVLNVPPTAGFTYSPAHVAVGDEVQFTDASTDPDGGIVGWLWDFGDGTTSALQHPTHSYVDGGDYDVTLTVTDDDGAAHDQSVALHVCETGITLGPGLRVRIEVCPRLRL